MEEIHPVRRSRKGKGEEDCLQMIFFGGSSPNVSWKRTSRHRAFRKRMSLLRTKSSDNMSTASAVGQTSDRPGRVNGSHGLVAIVIPSRQKIPAGMLALGLPWWLRW